MQPKLTKKLPLLGACRNSIFSCFLPFFAKKFVPDSIFSDARFFRADFLTFCEKSGTGGRPTVPDCFGLPDFGSRFSDFLPDFLCIPMRSREFRPLYPEATSYSSTMDANSQARVGRVGCSGGVPNYRNDILINVVEEYLPQGLEAWRGVAMAKPEEIVVDALGQQSTKS